METIKITVCCVICKKLHPIIVDKIGYINWRCGELIQNALPNNTLIERELLISNTCSKCFDEMFKEKEND